LISHSAELRSSRRLSKKKLKMKTSNLIRKILLFSKKRETMNTIFSWPPLS